MVIVHRSLLPTVNVCVCTHTTQADLAGVSVFLSTSSPENCEYYKRCGFVACAHGTVPFGGLTTTGFCRIPRKRPSQVELLQDQVELLKRQLASLGANPMELVSLEEARRRMQDAIGKLMQGDENVRILFSVIQSYQPYPTVLYFFVTYRFRLFTQPIIYRFRFVSSRIDRFFVVAYRIFYDLLVTHRIFF